MASQRPLSQAEALRQQRVLLMPQVEERFGFLRGFSVLLRVLGAVALIGGVVGAALALGGPTTSYDPILRQTVTTSPLTQALLTGGAGLLFFLGLYGAAEFLNLQIAQEENQRITNQLLYNLMARRQS